MKPTRNNCEKLATTKKYPTIRNPRPFLCGIAWMIVAAGLLLPRPAHAQYTYTTNNNTITITGYACAGGAGDVTIPNSLGGYPVTSIGQYTFEGCSSITNVTIPDSVTSIGVQAFFGCHGLTSVTIPNSVVSIGEWAFEGCFSLTSVMIPASVSNISDYAFANCTSLTNIAVDVSNAVYSSLAGAMFNKSQTVLIQYPGAPSGFYVIPDGVTSIGDGAFTGCYGLTNITIPNSVTNIGAWVFDLCTNLTNITLPNNLTSIGSDAFYSCRQLSTITIPASVTSIGTYAFYQCPDLTAAYFQGNAPSGGSNTSVFYDSTNVIVYYLPGATGFGATFGGQTTVLWQATVTVTASPSNSGTVSGSGTYRPGTNVLISATASNGWKFTGWSGGTPSDLAIITVPPTNITYTANFASASGESITSPIFAGTTNGLYDLTDLFTRFTASFNSGVQTNGQTNVVDISEGLSVVQSITGAVLATGTTTTVTVMLGDTGSFTFPAKYKFKGAVKSSGSNLLLTFAFAGKGSTVSNAVTTKYSESVTRQVTVDPAGTMTGRQTGTASQSGHGGGTIKILNPTIGPKPAAFAPVDWNLSLTLTETSTKVTGNAILNLANGRIFPFTVIGTTKNGTSTLKLTGTGTGKGATLTVTLTGNHITTISGSLLGQTVNLRGL